MTNIYEKGTIKVVWIKEDPEIIFSRMFADEKDALNFSENLPNNNYLIFHLISQTKMKDFSWKLLPYGRYKTYQTIISLNQNKSLSINKMLSELIST